MNNRKHAICICCKNVIINKLKHSLYCERCLEHSFNTKKKIFIKIRKFKLDLIDYIKVYEFKRDYDHGNTKIKTKKK